MTCLASWFNSTCLGHLLGGGIHWVASPRDPHGHKSLQGFLAPRLWESADSPWLGMPLNDSTQRPLKRISKLGEVDMQGHLLPRMDPSQCPNHHKNGVNCPASAKATPSAASKANHRKNCGAKCPSTTLKGGVPLLTVGSMFKSNVQVPYKGFTHGFDETPGQHHWLSNKSCYYEPTPLVLLKPFKLCQPRIQESRDDSKNAVKGCNDLVVKMLGFVIGSSTVQDLSTMIQSELPLLLQLLPT